MGIYRSVLKLFCSRLLDHKAVQYEINPSITHHSHKNSFKNNTAYCQSLHYLIQQEITKLRLKTQPLDPTNLIDLLKSMVIHGSPLLLVSLLFQSSYMLFITTKLGNDMAS